MKHHRAGFTLVEIAVTLAIIALVFTMVLSNSGNFNSRSSARIAMEALVSDIRLAAFKALSSEQFQLESPAAWGVQIDAATKTYAVFADLDNDGIYDLREKYKAAELPAGIAQISFTFNPAGGAYSGSAMNLVFPVQTGVPRVNGANITAATGSAEIYLRDATGSIQRTITINAAGAAGIE